MASHGGYRPPTNPAPVSGPGALSRRTDGRQPIMSLPDAAYGEQQTYRQIQQGAPMAQQSQPGPVSLPPQAATLGQLTQGLTPLSAPSAQPQTPVTDGAALGPGAGISALGLPSGDANQQDSAYLARYLPTLLKQANSDNATPGYKAWLRNVIANLA